MTYSVRDMLRERRKALGWSIRRAADETGIPYGTLGQYETGFAQPPLARLEQWAGGLGVKIVVDRPLHPLAGAIEEVANNLTDQEAALIRAVVEVARLRQ